MHRTRIFRVPLGSGWTKKRLADEATHALKRTLKLGATEVSEYHGTMTQSVGCAWELLRDDSLFITYCDDAATLEQWQAYIATMRSFKGRGSIRFLVYAQALPPREVLAEIASAARGEPWTVALISPSLAVRFAATTFAMVLKGFRFFSPEAIDAAITHLGNDPLQKRRAFEALDRLRGGKSSIRLSG